MVATMIFPSGSQIGCDVNAVARMLENQHIVVTRGKRTELQASFRITDREDPAFAGMTIVASMYSEAREMLDAAAEQEQTR